MERKSCENRLPVSHCAHNGLALSFASAVRFYLYRVFYYGWKGIFSVKGGNRCMGIVV